MTALGFEVERLDRCVPLTLATLSLALWGVAEVLRPRLFAGLLAIGPIRESELRGTRCYVELRCTQDRLCFAYPLDDPLAVSRAVSWMRVVCRSLSFCDTQCRS